MDQLARQLRMSKRTLYAHFPSRDALLEAVVDRFFDRLGDEVAALVSDESLPVQRRLESIIEQTAQQLASIDRRFLEQLEQNQPALAGHIRARRRQHVQRYLAPLLENAQEAGVVRSELPPMLIVEMAVACVDALTSPRLLPELPIPVRELPSTVLQTLMWGLLRPELRPDGGRREA